MDVYIIMHFETKPFKKKNNMPGFWEAINTNDFQGVLQFSKANNRIVS
jgi:hypothetical protein